MLKRGLIFIDWCFNIISDLFDYTLIKCVYLSAIISISVSLNIISRWIIEQAFLSMMQISIRIKD
jgi:hypothetical protein